MRGGDGASVVEPTPPRNPRFDDDALVIVFLAVQSVFSLAARRLVAIALDCIVAAGARDAAPNGPEALSFATTFTLSSFPFLAGVAGVARITTEFPLDAAFFPSVTIGVAPLQASIVSCSISYVCCRIRSSCVVPLQLLLFLFLLAHDDNDDDDGDENDDDTIFITTTTAVDDDEDEQ